MPANRTRNVCSERLSTHPTPSGDGSPATSTTASCRSWPACRWPSPRRASVEAVDQEQVVQASAAIRSSIKSLRSLLVEIYPANLEEEGLQSAVGDLLNVLAARGISTRLVADLQADRIDLEASTLAYRVAQEALRNVVSHAAATEVRVTLDVEHDSLDPGRR